MVELILTQVCLSRGGRGKDRRSHHCGGKDRRSHHCGDMIQWLWGDFRGVRGNNDWLYKCKN